jgi:hypothetical protein
MPTKAPNPIFEVVFRGIYPEKIPLGTLSRILAAVQRLVSGIESEEDDEQVPETMSVSGQIQLLAMKRSSAVYRFAGESTNQIMTRLRLVGDVLAHPEQLGENDYLLTPLERISTSAKTLGCDVTLRAPGNNGKVIATIGPRSYDEISRSIFVKGETSVIGNVQRVGGATEMRCALRLPARQRLLFCRVKTEAVARKLGDCLYKDVAVTGQAIWIRGTWRINAFTITGATETKKGSIIEAFGALHEAGGSGWDNVDDPERTLEEVTGK